MSQDLETLNHRMADVGMDHLVQPCCSTEHQLEQITQGYVHCEYLQELSPHNFPQIRPSLPAPQGTPALAHRTESALQFSTLFNY